MVYPSSVSALVFASSGYDVRLVFWAAAGAAVGIYLFIRGFLMLRYKRMIENTPASKIRSASMGLVELSGMAEGPQTIPAGITGEACFYYRAIAWELRQSGRSREWKKVADESLYVPFFINDMTRRMLVDAAGADMEVTRNFHDEFSASFFGGREMLPENVGKFMARNGVLGGESVRLEERCVKPGYPLFVFGTLAPRPAAGMAGWAVKPHVCGSSVGLDVDVTASRLSGKLGTNMTRMLKRIPGLQLEQHSITTGSVLASAAIVNRNGQNAVPPVTGVTMSATRGPVWSSVSVDEVELAHGGVRTAVAETPEEQTQTRVPDATTKSEDEAATTPIAKFGTQETCVPNMTAAIGKGVNGAPFMISSESQHEVLRALGWRCALFIWGGPILALISVYYLLIYFRQT